MNFKKLVFISFFLFFSVLNSMSQENSLLSIEELQTLKTTAVEEEKFVLADKYKTAISLKKDIKIAVDKEEFDKAISLKEKLNKMKFTNEETVEEKVKETTIPEKVNTSYSNVNPPVENYNPVNHGNSSSRNFLLTEGGFNLDFLIGGNVFGDFDLYMGMEMANTWYFGKARYSAGIKVNWIKFGYLFFNENFSLQPLQVGYGSVLSFGKNTGMEINYLVGSGVIIGDDEVSIGLNLNSQLKFNFSPFTIGFDFNSYLSLYNSGIYELPHVMSLSLGFDL